MSSFRKTLGAALIAFAASACSTDEQLRVETNDDAYFIMGVAPPNAKVTVAQGDIVGGNVRWHREPLSLGFTPYDDVPARGYIVGQALRGGDTLAIWKVRLIEGDGIFAGGETYQPCNRGQTAVFTVPGGRVVYVGDVRFAVDRGHVFGQFNTAGIALTPGSIDAARDFLVAHHPQLAGRLVAGEARMMPALGCP